MNFPEGTAAFMQQYPALHLSEYSQNVTFQKSGKKKRLGVLSV